MKILKRHISSDELTPFFEAVFGRLPKEYYKLYKDWQKDKRNDYYRTTPLSRWISMPLCTGFDTGKPAFVKRINNIKIKTYWLTEVIFAIHYNEKGIFGLMLPEDIESLEIETIDVKDYEEENIPISPFDNGITDIEEFIKDFHPVDMYFEDMVQSYLINNSSYYEVINLSDNNCIALNNSKSIFLLNKVTGFVKLLFNHPKEFIEAFTNNELDWLELTLPKIKNIYHPDEEDISNWIISETNWPASDWDYYVISNEKNDAYIYRMANDIHCKEREFFVHALYYFVGEYYEKQSIEYKERLEKFIEKIDDSTHIDVKQWFMLVNQLKSGKIKFDKRFWLEYFYT